MLSEKNLERLDRKKQKIKYEMERKRLVMKTEIQRELMR